MHGSANANRVHWKDTVEVGQLWAKLHAPATDNEHERKFGELIVGIAKSAWMETEERGWSAPSKHVCQSCVKDAYLRTIVRRNLTPRSCDYCKSARRKAAPVHSIMSAVSAGLLRSFNTYEAAGCPYGKDIPEIQSHLTINALQEIPLECNWDLLTDIANAFHNQLWVDAPGGMWMAAHAHEELSWSWNQFVHAVKHETRFHFGRARGAVSSGELLDVSEVLPFLAGLIRTHRLTRCLPVATNLIRVRLRKDGEMWLADDQQLGARSPETAPAGRMNPAGIPYFYAAFEESTALSEVGATSGANAVISVWETTRDLRIVDFTKLPLVPSSFDQKNRRKHEMLVFLSEFLIDISRPVTKDGSEHIEYVPTQVICEYIAQVFKTPSGGKIDGLLYSSSVVVGGKNLVVFPIRGNRWGRFGTVKLLGSTERTMS